MKIYKNPYVSRESYFVKTGKGHSYKNEASKSKGYAVDFIDGKWQVSEVCYYDSSLRNEMPVIAENKVSIQSVIERAILDAVLALVHPTVDEQPTADVAEVVRCKDCKYKTVTSDGEYNPEDIVCEYFMSDGFRETDFCSYGEREE